MLEDWKMLPRLPALLLCLAIVCGSSNATPTAISRQDVPTAPCLGDNCPTTPFVPPTPPCVDTNCPQTTQTTQMPTTYAQTTQTQTTQTSTQPPGDFRRTIIFMYMYTSAGEYLFSRGGLGVEQFPECRDYPEDYTSPCAISIQVNSLGNTTHYDAYNAWRVGDDKLDWGGAQPSQGTYKGNEASGTSMAWTSNDPNHPGYQQLNIWGPHHWMVDMEMDCAQTEGGWIEMKVLKVMGSAEYWENDVAQLRCIGDGAATPPYASKNHMARCGYINRFTFNDGYCEMYMF